MFKIFGLNQRKLKEEFNEKCNFGLTSVFESFLHLVVLINFSKNGKLN